MDGVPEVAVRVATGAGLAAGAPGLAGAGAAPGLAGAAAGVPPVFKAGAETDGGAMPTGAALGAPVGPPGGSVGNLMVGAAVGFGGRLMRTVSFFGCTLPVSFFGGGMAPVGMAGMNGAGGGVAGFGLGGGTSAIMLLPKISRASVLSNFYSGRNGIKHLANRTNFIRRFHRFTQMGKFSICEHRRTLSANDIISKIKKFFSSSPLRSVCDFFQIGTITA